jgi:hypothetical protein
MANNNHAQSSKPRMITVGKEECEIRDRAPSANYIDVILESAVSHGTVMLSLGAFNRDIPEEGIVDVTNRIRMNVFTAQRLHAILGNIIGDLQRQAEQRITEAAAAQQVASAAAQNRSSPKVKRIN